MESKVKGISCREAWNGQEGGHCLSYDDDVSSWSNGIVTCDMPPAGALDTWSDRRGAWNRIQKGFDTIPLREEGELKHGKDAADLFSPIYPDHLRHQSTSSDSPISFGWQVGPRSKIDPASQVLIKMKAAYLTTAWSSIYVSDPSYSSTH